MMEQIAGRFSDPRSRGTEAETGASPTPASGTPTEIDDELVRVIADRVYQCLLQDLKIERERLCLVSKKNFFHKGGR